MHVLARGAGRLAAAVAAAALGLGLAGCAPAEPSVNPSISPTTYLPTGTLPDFIFAAQHLSLGRIPLAGVSDLRIKSMGREICRQLSAGRSVTAVRNAFTGPGGNPVARATAFQADALIAAAVRNLCPQHDPQLPPGV